jgi:hypothetical protein
VRGAPRDALIADPSLPEIRGASFGLRQSLDTIGAFVGPLLAILLMLWTKNNFQTVFWIAVIPGFLAFGLMAFAIKEPERSVGLRPVKSPLSRREPARRGTAYLVGCRHRNSCHFGSARPSLSFAPNLSVCRSLLSVNFEVPSSFFSGGSAIAIDAD